MKFKIMKCIECNIYTLKHGCPVCNNKTVVAHPARFSPDDKYLIYKIKGLTKKRE